MTDLEVRAILYLERIRYARDIWHADRAKWLCFRVKRDPLYVFTWQEKADLWFLIWHYRRQVDDVELVARANEERGGPRALAFTAGGSSF
jgi:hypothetical protein